jgi:hypothetical protein
MLQSLLFPGWCHTLNIVNGHVRRFVQMVLRLLPVKQVGLVQVDRVHSEFAISRDRGSTRKMTHSGMQVECCPSHDFKAVCIRSPSLLPGMTPSGGAHCKNYLLPCPLRQILLYPAAPKGLVPVFSDLAAYRLHTRAHALYSRFGSQSADTPNRETRMPTEFNVRRVGRAHAGRHRPPDVVLSCTIRSAVLFTPKCGLQAFGRHR